MLSNHFLGVNSTIVIIQNSVCDIRKNTPISFIERSRQIDSQKHDENQVVIIALSDEAFMKLLEDFNRNETRKVATCRITHSTVREHNTVEMFTEEESLNLDIAVSLFRRLVGPYTDTETRSLACHSFSPKDSLAWSTHTSAQTSRSCGTAGPAVIDSRGPSSIFKSPNIRCFVAKFSLS